MTPREKLTAREKVLTVCFVVIACCAAVEAFLARGIQERLNVLQTDHHDLQDRHDNLHRMWIAQHDLIAELLAGCNTQGGEGDAPEKDKGI